MASSPLREHAGCRKVLQGELLSHARILFLPQALPVVAVDFEDREKGRRTTLHIAHIALSDTPLAEVQKMYPKGAQVSLLSDPWQSPPNRSVKSMEFRFLQQRPNKSSFGEPLPRDAALILFLQDPSLLEVHSYFSKKAMELYQSMDAAQLRKQGNLMFRKQNYQAAVQLYGMSITKLPSLEEHKESLVSAHSNRAECYLLLSMWKEAHDDCCKALQLDPLHDKSLFRQGKALHEMQEYRRACKVLDKVAKRNPENTHIQEALKKSQLFLLQSMTGDYSKFLEHYIMNGSSWDEAPECSEYLGPVEIRLTPDGKGRGLFATKDVKAGSLLMVCNAMAMARRRVLTMTDDSQLKGDVVTKLVRLCMKSKEHLRQLYTLADSWESCRTDVPPMCLFGPEKTMRAGGLFLQGHNDDLDAERISRIVDVTSYTLSCMIDKQGCDFHTSLFTGQWVISAFINNSCISNMTKIEVGEAAFFHASRDVKAGEELTVHYVDIHQPWSTFRREHFLEYKFECRCKRCSVEAAYEGKLKHVENAMAALGNRIFDNNDDDAQEALARLAPEVEVVIQDAGEDEKSMIRTSHVDAYCSYYKLMKQLGANISTVKVPPAEVLVQSLRFCAPGDIKTIQLIAMLTGEVCASDYWVLTGYNSGDPYVVSELHRQLQEKTWSWMKLLKLWL